MVVSRLVVVLVVQAGTVLLAVRGLILDPLLVPLLEEEAVAEVSLL